LDEINPELVGKMIEYLYHNDYSSDKNKDVSVPRCGSAGHMFHSNVYAMADMYRVEGLKATAVQEFEEAISAFGCDRKALICELLEVAEHAFTSTDDLESNRGMRDMVIRRLVEYRRFTRDEAVRKLLPVIGQVCYDMLLVVVYKL
jgi:ribosomal protein S15P/S13E